MFTFKFNSKEDTDTTTASNGDCKWKDSQVINPNDLKFTDSIIKSCQVNELTAVDLDIAYLSSADVISFLKKQNEQLSVLDAENSDSDLVTAEYEGGLKIWECTYDLLELIKQKQLNFKDKTVLDLGCGSGIIGLVTSLLGAQCCFQDYNDEVIKYITIPNVVLNGIKHNRDIDNCQFYSGDWKSFLSHIQNKGLKFDYIFTSETIYNIDNYSKLLNIFEALLKPDGKIYLAAKSYYFGVGGGISSFEEVLEKQHFNYNSCWQSSEGVKRVILEISIK